MHVVKYFRPKIFDGKRALVAYKLVGMGIISVSWAGRSLVWTEGRDVGVYAVEWRMGFIHRYSSRLLSQLSRLPASSFVKLCKVLFATFLALRSPTLDGPTVDRRATNRARHFI